ncbi:MAG: Bug family tripartite tricarboxylate transporter substrate binding protein [Alphaproteobacteria bacterium]
MTIRFLKLSASFAASLGVMLFGSLSPSSAQAQADFFSGKTMNVIVGYTPGGGYDSGARALARPMGKHISGKPNFVVQNMPGAGSIKAAMFIYSAAPTDGTTFGTFGRGVAVEPLFNSEVAKFDGTKFTWIGSTSAESSICGVWHTSKIKSWDDMLKHEFTGAGEGAGSDPDNSSAVLKNLFGVKIRLVTGYHGGSEMNLAIERGEVDSRCGWSWSSLKGTNPDWVPQKKLIPIVIFALNKNPELPGVPVITDFVKTAEQAQIVNLFMSRQEMAWPFAAPPNLAPERARTLRAAFDATMKDPAFVAEMAKIKRGVEPMTGLAVEKMLRDIYATPPEVVAKARQIIADGAR